jgi:hypothetical protein
LFSTQEAIFGLTTQKTWYARQDSNLWPLAPEASALSAELRAHLSDMASSVHHEDFDPVREAQKLAAVPLQALPFAGYSGPRLRVDPCCAIHGGTMTSGDPSETGHIRLSDDDVAYLMNVLRNSSQPVTTQQLIDVLRRQSDQQRGGTDSQGSNAE